MGFSSRDFAVAHMAATFTIVALCMETETLNVRLLSVALQRLHLNPSRPRSMGPFPASRNMIWG